jgi:hypothetical protein
MSSLFVSALSGVEVTALVQSPLDVPLLTNANIDSMGLEFDTGFGLNVSINMRAEFHVPVDFPFRLVAMATEVVLRRFVCRPF